MRARTFDAPMLAQVPDMLSKIDAVMAGTKAEPKNAVTLLSMLPMIAEAANAGDFVFWQPDSLGERLLLFGYRPLKKCCTVDGSCLVTKP